MQYCRAAGGRVVHLHFVRATWWKYTKAPFQGSVYAVSWLCALSWKAGESFCEGVAVKTLLSVTVDSSIVLFT